MLRHGKIQRAIRAFLKVRTSYDVLPLSFRLIVFDTALLVKKSLNILIHNGIVSAPLWDSKTSTFAGLLTTSDYINVIQYYWQNPDALAQVDQFRLNSLRGRLSQFFFLPFLFSRVYGFGGGGYVGGFSC